MAVRSESNKVDMDQGDTKEGKGVRRIAFCAGMTSHSCGALPIALVWGSPPRHRSTYVNSQLHLFFFSFLEAVCTNL